VEAETGVTEGESLHQHAGKFEIAEIPQSEEVLIEVDHCIEVSHDDPHLDDPALFHLSRPPHLWNLVVLP